MSSRVRQRGCDNGRNMSEILVHKILLGISQEVIALQVGRLNRALFTTCARLHYPSVVMRCTRTRVSHGQEHPVISA